MTKINFERMLTPYATLIIFGNMNDVPQTRMIARSQFNDALVSASLNDEVNRKRGYFTRYVMSDNVPWLHLPFKQAWLQMPDIAYYHNKQRTLTTECKIHLQNTNNQTQTIYAEDLPENTSLYDIFTHNTSCKLFLEGYDVTK